MYFGLIYPAANFYVWFGSSIIKKISFKVSLLTLWPWLLGKNDTIQKNDSMIPCENVQQKCDLERMLKGSFFGSLNICSKGHFFGP